MVPSQLIRVSCDLQLSSIPGAERETPFIHGDTLEMCKFLLPKGNFRTSLVVQWLRLCAPSAGAAGSIPGQGTRPHMRQLRVYTPQLTIPHAATKAWCSQINKNKYLKN